MVGAQANTAERATAQALFDTARKLMEEGRHVEACPKLEESQRLDPGIGTRFNLAVCYEAIGRTASAWSLFIEVAAEASSAAQRAREEVARKRAESLEPRLSRLKVVVPPDAQVDGLKIMRGKVEVGRAQWGLPVPADPGVHVVRAVAPGRELWETEVEIPADGNVYTLTIVPLEAAPEKNKDELESPPENLGFFASLSLQQKIGLSVAGAGVVGLGVGSVFGLLALSDNDASAKRCEGNLCDAEGFALRNDARDKGNIATVAFVAGGALLGTGAVLFLTGSVEQPGPAPSASAAAFYDGQRAFLQLRGTF